MHGPLNNSSGLCDRDIHDTFYRCPFSISAAQESDEFREVLRDCCADIAHETSMELLQRYRDEARTLQVSNALRWLYRNFHSANPGCSVWIHLVKVLLNIFEQFKFLEWKGCTSWSTKLSEARSAELAHAFPANALASVWPDVTLKELDFPWCLNEWQAPKAGSLMAL